VDVFNHNWLHRGSIVYGLSCINIIKEEKMKKFAIVDTADCRVISRHKNLDLANAKLRKIDAVKYSLYATDVDWLQGEEEALQGYRYKIDAKL
jgi:hypothetical protein